MCAVSESEINPKITPRVPAPQIPSTLMASVPSVFWNVYLWGLWCQEAERHCEHWRMPSLWGLWSPLTEEFLQPFGNKCWKWVLKSVGQKPFFCGCLFQTLSVAPQAVCTSESPCWNVGHRSEGVWAHDADLCSESSQRDLCVAVVGTTDQGVSPRFLPLINTTTL